MGTVIKNVSRSFALRTACMLLVPVLAYATPADWEPLYADMFERLTGQPLTEEGVRAILSKMGTGEQKSVYGWAAISVVGERKLVGLVPDLKAMYHRQPEDVHRDLKFLYKSPGTKDTLQARIARALIRCGDPEGEAFALELAMRSDTMGARAALASMRNLRVLTREFGTDVSKKIEFLLDLHMNRVESVAVGRIVARRLLRVLHDIKRYAELTESADLPKYIAVIARCRELAPSDMRATVENMGGEFYNSSWEEIRRLEREMGIPPADVRAANALYDERVSQRNQ